MNIYFVYNNNIISIFNIKPFNMIISILLIIMLIHFINIYL